MRQKSNIQGEKKVRQDQIEKGIEKKKKKSSKIGDESCFCARRGKRPNPNKRKKKIGKKKNHNLNKKKDIHLSLRLREKTDVTSSFMNLLYNNDFTTTNH